MIYLLFILKSDEVVRLKSWSTSPTVLQSPWGLSDVMRRVIVLLLDQRQDSDSEGGEAAQWEEVWGICMERVKCEISLTSYYHFNQSEGDLSPNNNSV